MKRLIFIMLVGMLLSSCVALQPKPSVCDKPDAEGSVICALAGRIGTTPEQLDFMLRLGTAVALDSNPDEAGEALRYLDKATALLNGTGITYDALAMLLKNKPLTFVVATEVIDQMVGLENPLGELLPISEFDIGLLRTHVERQKQLIQIAIGE